MVQLDLKAVRHNSAIRLALLTLVVVDHSGAKRRSAISSSPNHHTIRTITIKIPVSSM